MDTKDLRGFIRSYESGSINKAAQDLFISPQGLGKVIDRLESELDTQLFQRTPNGLIPTEAGIYFYERSIELLHRIQDIEIGIKQLSKVSNQLHIGYSCGVLNVIDINKIDNYSELHPEINISWEEKGNDEIKELILNRKLDVAFVVGKISLPAVFQKKIFSIPYSAIVGKNHPFASRNSISMEDLKGERLITLNEKYQSYYDIIQRCSDFDFVPDIRIKTMESSIIYRFASEGSGVGIDVNIHDSCRLDLPVHVVEITDSIPWTIYLIWAEENSSQPWMRDFTELFQKSH